MIGLVAWVAVVVWVGSTLVRRLGLAPRPRLAQLALGWGVGSFAFGGALVILGACGVPLGPGLLSCLGLFCVGGGFTLRLQEPGSLDWGWPKAKAPLDRLALAAMATVALLIIATSLQIPLLSVDARTLWSYHARLIHETGAYPAAELRNPAFLIPHPQYPPLVPMLEAAAAWAAGSASDAVLRAVPTLFYAATALLLLVELPRKERRFGLLLAAAWVLMPTLVLFEEGGADSGLADVALSFYVLASAVAMDGGAPLLAGLLAGAGALTKNEGLVLGTLLCLSGLGVRGGWRSKAALPLGFLAVVVPWLLLRASIPAGMDERYLSRLSVATLSSLALRAGPTLVEMARSALAFPQRSGLFWWLLAFWWLRSPRKREHFLQGRLWMLPVYFGSVLVAYLVSPWPGPTQVQLSFPRILLHVAPLALWGLVASRADAPGRALD